VINRLEKQWAAEDRKLGAHIAAAVQVDAPGKPNSFGLEELAGMDDDADMGGALLPGWEQIWSDDNKCFYYWHTATGTASWERPTTGEPDDDKYDAAPAELWEGEGSEEGAAWRSTPKTPATALPTKQSKPTRTTPARTSQQDLVPSAKKRAMITHPATARKNNDAAGAAKPAKPQWTVPKNAKQQRLN